MKTIKTQKKHGDRTNKYDLRWLALGVIGSLGYASYFLMQYLARALAMCLPFVLTMAISTAAIAETEQEFCEAYVQMIQGYHQQIQSKSDEATQLLLQARATQDPTLRASRLAAAKVLEAEANQIVNSQMADVLIKDTEAQTKFGKRLRNMTLNGIPLPGCVDVFVWVVLARESIHYEGLAVSLQNLAYDVIPDVAQVGGLVVGGGAFVGAMAVLELQQIDTEVEDWKAQTREAFKLQGGSWRRNDFDKGTRTDKHSPNIAAMQQTLNTFVDDQRTYQGKARDTAEMEFIISLVQEAQQMDRLNGDVNEDGTVDNNDANTLQQNFGVPAGATWDMGDFDGDGDVDLQDLLILNDEF